MSQSCLIFKSPRVFHPLDFHSKTIKIRTSGIPNWNIRFLQTYQILSSTDPSWNPILTSSWLNIPIDPQVLFCTWAQGEIRPHGQGKIVRERGSMRARTILFYARDESHRECIESVRQCPSGAMHFRTLCHCCLATYAVWMSVSEIMPPPFWPKTLSSWTKLIQLTVQEMQRRPLVYIINWCLRRLSVHPLLTILPHLEITIGSRINNCIIEAQSIALSYLLR
jgi:hypothetical protein